MNLLRRMGAVPLAILAAALAVRVILVLSEADATPRIVRRGRAIPWHLWVTRPGLTRYRIVADPLLQAAVALVELSRARGRGGRAPRPCPPSP